MSELVLKYAIKSAIIARASPAAAAAFVIAATILAIIAGAYFFQYALQIPPCPLCLTQRKFHYLALALALVTGFAAVRRMPRPFLVAALVTLALILLAGAGVAVYHSGVEWKLWAGPQDCSGPLVRFGNVGSLLDQMEKTSVVRCDEPAWRLFGLSLAGYNAIISLALCAVAAWGALQQRVRA